MHNQHWWGHQEKVERKRGTPNGNLQAQGIATGHERQPLGLIGVSKDGGKDLEKGGNLTCTHYGSSLGMKCKTVSWPTGRYFWQRGGAVRILYLASPPPMNCFSDTVIPESST